MGKLRQGRRRRGHTAPEAADRYASLVPWCWSPGSTQGLPPPPINHGLPPQRLLRTPSCPPPAPGGAAPALGASGE